ncbi:FecR domain-containing protein [Acetobacter sp. TBRC 12305]|uniref:FecR domain-containing protein n=1 Tax=Acetobacter garciniae TaxID=2817435 RepID=A0A939HMP1_9PROT|nr:FecR domain-containing protein [Acetobacter garciniae]MBO1324464.1 FecR domain-containing protein [Acetobacter garciniae]MBX0344153.1 FecR domain-containing protein [Acetobacter garciniae]
MTEQRTPRQAAADWYLFLREDPDDRDLKIQFERWLNEDPAHAAAWARMNATATRIVTAHETLHGPAPAGTPLSAPVRRRAIRPSPRFFLPIAACAAICALAVLNGPDLLVALRADYVTPVGATRAIRLADGSAVTLGPRSAIAVKMTPDGRHVRLLRGEALFDVHHDAERPFSVQAEDVETTDIGTVFDVRMQRNATTVAVRQGAVHVRQPGRADRDLQPGQWIRISGDITTGTMPIDAIGAWRTGTLIANDQTVSDVIAALRPWTGARIVLTSRALGEQRVTGTYDLHQPEASLRLIVGPYGGRVTPITPWFDIISAR